MRATLVERQVADADDHVGALLLEQRPPRPDAETGRSLRQVAHEVDLPARLQHRRLAPLEVELHEDSPTRVSPSPEAVGPGDLDSIDGLASYLPRDVLAEAPGEQRVEIRVFHTPNLTGLRKQIVPRRINEGWGLQHMKLYAFDDELIMSGYVSMYLATAELLLTTSQCESV